MAASSQQSWFRYRASTDDVVWAEAFFRGIAYAPHRHDTYAVGCTTRGVQTFQYRGEARRSAVGDVFVLHPDELHDGRQGTDAGYGYRIVYLAPSLVAEAVGSGPLPFVPEAVSRDARLRQAVAEAFPDPADARDDVLRAHAITTLADALHRLAGSAKRTRTRVDVAEMRRVRDHLLQAAPGSVSMAELERAHGIGRFRLSRQFRKAFGVSPYRFVTLRRLDLAKRQIAAGRPLAEAARMAGFADQSHMTRQFRKGLGLSPGTWKRLLR